MARRSKEADREYRKWWYRKNKARVNYLKMKWRKRNPDAYKREYAKARPKRLSYASWYRRKIKHEVIMEYGGKCACCSEQKMEMLGLDHIFGDGSYERKRIFGDKNNKNFCGYQFAIWLKKNGYPKGRIQVLCHSCNQAKRNSPLCPHEWDRLNRGSAFA